MTTTVSTDCAELNDARLEWTGDQLLATSGAFSRCWRLVPSGLLTCALSNGATHWVDEVGEAPGCDWSVWQLITAASEAELMDMKIEAVEAPPLTSPHVRAVLDFRYAETEVVARYEVQVFPGAPGVRTQLSLRAMRPMGKDEVPSWLLQSYAESLPLDPSPLERDAIGYYNDPQHRNHDDTPILRREARAGALAEQRREVYDWANILCLERGDDGLALVKESHKCVNQSGIDTGAFVEEGDR